MGEDEREEVAEDREEVAEDVTPETDTEATEQRTDDYDGLARRLDDVLEKLAALDDDLAKLDTLEDKLDRIEGLYSTFVDAGAIVTGATDEVAAAAAEGVADAIEAALDLESLDYSL